MALHAVRDVEDAVEVTRSFLLPFDRRRWLKLAFVAFFLGGGVGAPTFGGNGTTGTVGSPSPVTPPELSRTVLLALVAVVVIVVLLAVAFAVVGSIMEFVLVESLRSGTVTIRRYWGRRWRQGLRLFGFRLVVGLVGLVVGLVLLAIAVGPVLVGVPLGSLVTALLAVPLFVLLAVVGGLVNGFTTAFVVPIMILDGGGVLAGWRRLWPTVRAEWKQYLAYAVVAFVLRVALGLAAGLVLAIAAFVLAVPIGGVGLLVVTTLSLDSAVGLALVAVLAVVFGLAAIVLWAFVQVPVQTYLGYYALLVLGDVEEAFDLVPDRRAAVRE